MFATLTVSSWNLRNFQFLDLFTLSFWKKLSSCGKLEFFFQWVFLKTLKWQAWYCILFCALRTQYLLVYSAYAQIKRATRLVLQKEEGFSFTWHESHCQWRCSAYYFLRYFHFITQQWWPVFFCPWWNLQNLNAFTKSKLLHFSVCCWDASHFFHPSGQ